MFEFEAKVMPAVVRRAKMVFRGWKDAPELVADSVSVAWELARTTPSETTPQSLAWYATRRVISGRVFTERQRSVTGPNPRRLAKPQRNELVEVLIVSDDPADIAQVRLDFEAWLDMLTERERGFLIAFMRGDRTTDIARECGCSKARVSQIRKELAECWQAFTA